MGNVLRACILPLLILLSGCSSGGDGESIDQTMALSVSATTPSEAYLSWSAHSNSVTGYDVYRNGTPLFSTHISGTSVTDNGLEPSTGYCYIVYAVVWPLGIVGRSNEACVTTASGTSGWYLETIAQGSDAGLALDSSNQPHVSYSNNTGVYLAYKSGGTWHYSPVDGLSSVPNDVAVDSGGADHIVYIDNANDRILHATNRTGAWVSDIVDTAVGLHVAVAVDSSGYAHLAYDSEIPTTAVAHATNTAGSWVVTRMVGFSDGNITDTDIAVDTSGNIHIALAVQGLTCYVYYYTNQGGTWSEQIVANGCNGGVSLAIDLSGHIHIAYSDRFGLMHATNSSGTWQSQQLDSFSWIGGKGVGLAIDTSNRLHIAYQDNNHDLKYTTNVSGSWMRYYIEARGDVGNSPSISVDATGRVRIVYADATNNTVKLATSP